MTLCSRSTADDVETFSELLSRVLARGARPFCVIVDLESAHANDAPLARAVGRVGKAFVTASRPNDQLAVVASAEDGHALALGHLVLSLGTSGWSRHETLDQALEALGRADAMTIAQQLATAVLGELGTDEVRPALRAYLAGAPGASLAQSSRALGTASRTLQRALLAEATSFAAERTAVRMQLAASLLERSGWTVEAVAHEVGYGSVPRFIAVFVDHFGATPGKWREGRVR